MSRLLLVAFVWFVALGPVLSAVPAATGAVATRQTGADAVGSTASSRQAAGEVIPGRYVVVYRDGVAASRRARSASQDLNIPVDRHFNHVIRGFSATLTPAQVRQLQQDDAVAFVEPDRIFEAHAKLPTGVDRVGADSTANHARPPRAGDPVAVLDSGIGPHPALNLVGGHNCLNDGSPNFGDAFGHGTHVAGIIGARGARPGVAPGTPLFAIKVLDNVGIGSTTSVICGLDWVAANHDQYGITVANLSLGGPDSTESTSDCASSIFHTAICNLADEGVSIVTSAGNDNIDARFVIPAKYDQVVTVGAMTDTDGCRGGKGPPSSWGQRDRDDRKWIWSNHGPAVDVIAPGVDIRSTLPGGRYGVNSGTSMATPHVAAAIALGWEPIGGRVQTGIPGFPQLGLVLLSGHIGCGDGRAESITVGRTTVPPGGTITVRLTNFESRERVRVTIGGRHLGVITVNARGAGRRRLTVPDGLNPGLYRLRARGNDGGADSVQVRVRQSERQPAPRTGRENVAWRR